MWWSAPENVNGYQYPRTGEAYAGFTVFPSIFSQPPEAREYLEVELLEPMVTDTFYSVKMYVSLANDYKAACDCVSVWFTETVVDAGIECPPVAVSPFVEGFPQLVTPEGHYLADTAGWMELCWIYKATGGEKFMTIGSFEERDEMGIIAVNGGNGNGPGYYYFDDISVEKVPWHEVNLGLPDEQMYCLTDLPSSLTAQGDYTTYLWSTGDTTQSIEVAAPGTYWVEGSNGLCKWRDTVEVIVLDEQFLTLGGDMEVCPDDFLIEINGPEHMDSYQWSTGQTDQGLAIDQPGAYWLEASHACGVFRDTVEVSLVAVPPIDLGGDTVLCDQPVFQRTLTAPAGYDAYAWSTGATAESIDVTLPGTYWVQASYECGINADTIAIENQPLLGLDLGSDTTFCRGEIFLLSANAGFAAYHWNTGEESQAIEVSDYGTYSLTASYVCGTLNDTIHFSEPPPLSVVLPGDTLIRLGEEISIPAAVASSASSSLQWEPPTGLDCTDCPTPFARPLASTLYTLTVEDPFGCRASDGIFIGVENLQRVFVPTAFSPNGDGANDLFAIFGGPEVEALLSLKIFDRWGEMVFSKENLPPDGSEGWDGDFKGKAMAPGVFVYLAKVKFLDGSKAILSGEVMLVR